MMECPQKKSFGEGLKHVHSKVSQPSIGCDRPPEWGGTLARPLARPRSWTTRATKDGNAWRNRTWGTGPRAGPRADDDRNPEGNQTPRQKKYSCFVSAQKEGEGLPRNCHPLPCRDKTINSWRR